MKWMYLIFASAFLCLTAYSQELKPKVTFLIAEREYFTEETLPIFARSYLENDYQTAYCFADKEGKGRHILNNPKSIDSADLLFVSVRRRAFSTQVMNRIREHINKGNPVVGIRTASHAFQLRKETLPTGHQEWTTWDSEIIGGNYNGHLGKGLPCLVSRSSNKAAPYEILKGINLPFSTPATLYRNSPLPTNSFPLLKGTVTGYPPEPVAWVHRTPAKGKVFYTSLGHTEDFKKPAFNQLLKNAIEWCLAK